ncbi:TIM barrel protein [Candidatus Poribacteria bacterium]|nr:TIM barrel protein [Candidatus Poribacteria bacterium]
MKLGMVTYNLGRAWSVDAIIEHCTQTGFEGVELRTTHAHGVEISLTASERSEIKLRFADSPVALAGLGSAFEYHSIDADEVRRNIDGTKLYARLARDVGAPGIKVRPNGLPKDVPVYRTLEQIGLALRECAQHASGIGVEVRLEVHGGGTSELPHIRTILDYADHANLRVCWNSNATDVVGGSIRDTFALVRGAIGLVHITELWNPSYPYRDLFALLADSGYDGFCLAEIAESSEPDRLMRYYRALFDAMQP